MTKVAGYLIILLTIGLARCAQKQNEHTRHGGGPTEQKDKKRSNGITPINASSQNNTHPLHGDTKANTYDTSSPDVSWHTLPTNKSVIARQPVVKPVYSSMNFPVTATGYVTFDLRRNHKVPVRVGGRIERLYIKYNYQYVRRGEKLMDLYSPELNTYTEEYLYLKKHTTDSVLQRRARGKLLLLGLSPAQVKRLDQSGQPPFTLPVYSPVEGYVLFDPSAATSPAMGTSTRSAPGMGGMGSIQQTAQTTYTSGNIREGMYVNKDQTLFWINDFKVAWGILAFTKGEEKYIRKGQVVVLESELLPGQPFRATIQFTEPTYQQGQKFTQARVFISNARGILKQNSLLKATIFMPAQALVVPLSSIYYLGHTAIVWVQSGTTRQGTGVFQARVVRTGRRLDDKIEILDGITEHEVVAKDAAYLADSETIIQY